MSRTFAKIPDASLFFPVPSSFFSHFLRNSHEFSILILHCRNEFPCINRGKSGHPNSRYSTPRQGAQKGGINVIENVDLSELPMGFGMALAKNAKALTAFAALTEERRREVIDGTHTIQSKREMQEYVDHLTLQG